MTQIKTVAVLGAGVDREARQQSTDMLAQQRDALIVGFLQNRMRLQKSQADDQHSE